MKRFLSAALTLVCLTSNLLLFSEREQAIAQSNFLSNSDARVGSYSIKAPTDYSLQEISNVPSPAYGYAFISPTRADGTSGQILVIYRPLIATDTPNVEDVIRKRLAATQNYYKNWLQSGLEVASINGISFHRIRWSGTHRTQNVTMQGFLYVAIHQNEIIYLSSQDLAQHQSDLNRANISVLSFSSSPS